MVEGDDFKADAQRANMDLNILSGEQLQKIIDNAAKIPPEVVQRAKAARDQVQ